MGFEYGYSTTEPNALVVWEGQYGDFANAPRSSLTSSSAQARRSGSVSAVSHCSCRTGMKVPAPSTPPHAWSVSCNCAPNGTCRSVCPPHRPRCFTCCAGRCLQPFRKPLIVMTPKSLLRHEMSVSSLEELTRGSFARVIDETDELAPAQVRRARILQRQGVLRPVEGPPQGRDPRRGAGSHRAVVSLPQRRIRGNPESLQQRARDRVVPGRTAEPGRVVPDPPPFAGTVGGAPPGVVCGPCSGSSARDWHRKDSRGRATRTHRCGVASDYHRGFRSGNHSPDRKCTGSDTCTGSGCGYCTPASVMRKSSK